jgi:gas vesicle protein GvpL/GvpF
VSPLYVYALVDAGAMPLAVRGLAGEPLELVGCGPVAALVGTVDGAPQLEAAALRAHDMAVRAIADGVTALLPARFGTLVEDATALREALEPRGSALQAALAEVRGREQMTLRLSSAEALDEPAPDVRGGPGTRYLDARSGGALRRRPAVARVLAGLRELVRAERVEPVDRPPLLGTVYHLVDRGAAAAYLARLEALRRDVPGLRLAASGPWPPYAFAEAVDR